jgi:(aminoalkyl)phosphonate N-acetyltransferase
MLKHSFTIRSARNHDAKKIYQFLCEKEERLFDLPQFENNYRLCLADSSNLYLVAVDQHNDAIGFISCHGQTLLHHGGIVFAIQELFVEKRYRKKGIGKLLLKGLEDHLCGRDYLSLEVNINKKRIDTIEFYKGSGFKETHLQFTRNKK